MLLKNSRQKNIICDQNVWNQEYIKNSNSLTKWQWLRLSSIESSEKINLLNNIFLFLGDDIQDIGYKEVFNWVDKTSPEKINKLSQYKKIIDKFENVSKKALAFWIVNNTKFYDLNDIESYEMSQKLGDAWKIIVNKSNSSSINRNNKLIDLFREFKNTDIFPGNLDYSQVKQFLTFCSKMHDSGYHFSKDKIYSYVSDLTSSMWRPDVFKDSYNKYDDESYEGISIEQWFNSCMEYSFLDNNFACPDNLCVLDNSLNEIERNSLFYNNKNKEVSFYLFIKTCNKYKELISFNSIKHNIFNNDSYFHSLFNQYKDNLSYSDRLNFLEYYLYGAPVNYNRNGWGVQVSTGGYEHVKKVITDFLPELTNKFLEIETLAESLDTSLSIKYLMMSRNNHAIHEIFTQRQHILNDLKNYGLFNDHPNYELNINSDVFNFDS